MTTTKFVFLLLSLVVLAAISSSPTHAATFDVGRGVPVLVTTTCLYNGVLYADNASVEIYGAGNVSVLNATGMNQISPGVFALNYTFNDSGDFLTVETCFFPGGVLRQGSDEYRVGESFFAFILLGLAIVLLIGAGASRVPGVRRPMMFFSAVMFILFVVTIRLDWVVSAAVLLLALLIMYAAFRMK